MQEATVRITRPGMFAVLMILTAIILRFALIMLAPEVASSSITGGGRELAVSIVAGAASTLPSVLGMQLLKMRSVVNI